VHQHKGIDAEGKELVEDDEGGEEVLSEDSQTEDEQANTAQSGNVSANSSWCYEHPPVERGQVVRTPPYFWEEASQRCYWFSGNREEVDEVTQNMKCDRHQAGETTNDVEIKGIVERNDVSEGSVSQYGHQVSAHGKEENGKGIHHR